MYDIQMSAKAKADVQRLPNHISNRIIEKLKEYRAAPDPMRFATRLSGAWRGLYRFRIGDYRAIFEKSKDGQLVILLVLRVKHRREVYE